MGENIQFFEVLKFLLHGISVDLLFSFLSSMLLIKFCVLYAVIRLTLLLAPLRIPLSTGPSPFLAGRLRWLCGGKFL